MKANEVLKAALGHMEDRAATYDKPEGERSMPATVSAFNALTGHQLTAEQGWLFMTVLKLCRTQQGGFRADNYEDGAAYFALMGEQAAGDRQFGEKLISACEQVSEQMAEEAVLDTSVRDIKADDKDGFGLPLKQDWRRVARGLDPDPAHKEDPYGPRDAEGWYAWNGDETMRPAGKVHYIMRGWPSYEDGDEGQAEGLRWTHDRTSGDIVKWRPAQ